MRKRQRKQLFILAAVVIMGSIVASSAYAIGRTQTVDRKAAPTTKTKNANDLEARLDKILETQAAILSKFDQAMEELQIVKTRASIQRCP